MKKIILITVALSFNLSFIKVNAQQEDFTKYDVSCYCMVSGQSPNNILNLDNNGSIVLQLIDGKSEDQLNNISKSQLELLKAYRLIKKVDDKWKTNFSILNEQSSTKLRELAKNSAIKIDPLIKNDLTKLITVLEKIKREKNIYTIFFSYVLDELVWNDFNKQNLLKERSITAETPFWNGVVWAVYPLRKFSCGTNKIRDSGVSLNVNWTEKTIKNMLPFVADWKNMLKMFDDIMKNKSVTDKEAREVFDKFNLYDSHGNFTVPVIVESEGNELFANCLKLSNAVSSSLIKEIDLMKITDEFNFNTTEEALVIFYHEVMWEMLDYYENQNIISKPAAFSNPETCKPEDISDLVFIVKQK